MLWVQSVLMIGGTCGHSLKSIPSGYSGVVLWRIVSRTFRDYRENIVFLFCEYAFALARMDHDIL